MKPVEPEEVKTSVGNKQDTCKQSKCSCTLYPPLVRIRATISSSPTLVFRQGEVTCPHKLQAK